MGKYSANGKHRKVNPRIWNDEKFRALSPWAKLIFFFLLTHPHQTPLGAFRASSSGLKEELGWDDEVFFGKDFAEAFQEVLDLGLVIFNKKASYIEVPNFLKYNLPESPNVVKAYLGCLHDIPECVEKIHLLQRVKDLLEGLSEAFAEPFREAYLKAMPNQEQEQEQEQYKDIPRISGKKTTKKNPVPQKAVQTDSVNLLFEEFWQAYPDRNGKKLERAATCERFEELSEEEQGQVIQAARHYAASQNVRAGIGIRDPKRFLRDGKGSQPWKDWLEPEKPSSNGNGHHTAMTCSNRIQYEDGRIRDCGKSAAASIRNRPLCEECYRAIETEREVSLAG